MAFHATPVRHTPLFLTLYVAFSLSLSYSVYLYLSPSLSNSLSPSLSVPACLHISLFLSFAFALSVSRPLYIYEYVSKVPLLFPCFVLYAKYVIRFVLFLRGEGVKKMLHCLFGSSHRLTKTLLYDMSLLYCNRTSRLLCGVNRSCLAEMLSGLFYLFALGSFFVGGCVPAAYGGQSVCHAVGQRWGAKHCRSRNVRRVVSSPSNIVHRLNLSCMCFCVCLCAVHCPLPGVLHVFSTYEKHHFHLNLFRKFYPALAPHRPPKQNTMKNQPVHGSLVRFVTRPSNFCFKLPPGMSLGEWTSASIFVIPAFFHC